jgi:hypothetical protein
VALHGSCVIEATETMRFATSLVWTSNLSEDERVPVFYGLQRRSLSHLPDRHLAGGWILLPGVG